MKTIRDLNTFYKVLNAVSNNIDTNIKMMQMITEHYKYQLKMMLQSLKEFSLVIQDIYDYVIENR